MLTKPSTELTLFDTLSRLTFVRATKLLGADGNSLIAAGGKYDIDITTYAHPHRVSDQAVLSLQDKSAVRGKILLPPISLVMFRFGVTPHLISPESPHCPSGIGSPTACALMSRTETASSCTSDMSDPAGAGRRHGVEFLPPHSTHFNTTTSQHLKKCATNRS